MAKVTVTSAGVQILDGTQTVNTIVSTEASPVSFGVGPIGGRVFSDLAVIPAWRQYIFPPSVIVTLYALPSKTNAYVKTEVFGV